MDAPQASEPPTEPDSEQLRGGDSRDSESAATESAPVVQEAGERVPSGAPGSQQEGRGELPLRAEEAVAKLQGNKRERDHSQSPGGDNDRKRLKESHASPGPEQPAKPQTPKSKSKSPSKPRTERRLEPEFHPAVPAVPADSHPGLQREQETVQEPEKASDRPDKPSKSLEATESSARREIVVDSSSVIQNVAGLERRCLGSVVYQPGKILDRGHELDLNCVLQVRVGHEFLSRDATPVRRRELWGTQVYTDDSDLVAVLAHEGLLPEDQSKSDHDLNVEILLLPVLERYAGSYRHGLNSREWRTRHDGISYMVLNKPRVMPRGWSFSGVDQQIERIRLLAEARDWKPVDLAYADKP